MEENVYAIRGATTVEHDSPAEIDEAVRELMEAIYSENGITDSDAAFILFSQTRDIRTRNAAAIRVMILVNHKKEREARMVYLRGASSLRPEYTKKEKQDD